MLSSKSHATSSLLASLSLSISISYYPPSVPNPHKVRTLYSRFIVYTYDSRYLLVVLVYIAHACFGYILDSLCHYSCLSLSFPLSSIPSWPCPLLPSLFLCPPAHLSCHTSVLRASSQHPYLLLPYPSLIAPSVDRACLAYCQLAAAALVRPTPRARACATARLLVVHALFRVPALPPLFFFSQSCAAVCSPLLYFTYSCVYITSLCSSFSRHTRRERLHPFVHPRVCSCSSCSTSIVLTVQH